MADHTFIIVKYGDNQEAIFNSWCSAHTLLEYIRKKCRCDEDVVIDLVDLDGQVRNLSSSADEYASDLVNGRETYVLIRVEKQDDNGRNRYISLLNNLDQINPDLMVKLNSISRTPSRLKKNKGRTKTGKSHKPETPAKRPSSSERRNKPAK